MAISVTELVDRVSNFSTWKDQDKVCLFGWHIQANLERPYFNTSDITSCYEAVHIALPSNLSQILSRMASSKSPQILKTSRGYKLEKGTLDKFKQRFVSQADAQNEFPMPDFLLVVIERDLAKILRDRWQETHKTFRAGAYLSTIIMLGSILEGMLLAKVKANPKAANTITSSPKNSSGKVLPFKDWTLDDLIRVSHDCSWLEKDVRDFSSILRGYRNLVHPNQQLIEGVKPTVNTCRISWEVVRAAFNDLAR